MGGVLLVPASRLYRDAALTSAAPSRTPVTIAIETSQPLLVAIAHSLAASAALPIHDPIDHAREGLILAMRDDGWELRDAISRPGRGYRIDFSHVLPRSRALRGRAANLSRKQPLAQAMGRGSKRIIDATAGLGHDAALLAAMGFEVVAIERNAVLAALLNDAIRRAASNDRSAKALGERLRNVHGDAKSILASDNFVTDCIYLDPMFPPKRKASALAKKEIRLVRELVGDDVDSAELLAIARMASPRVVVKRPHHAQPLSADVLTTIETNLVRYDVYTGA